MFTLFEDNGLFISDRKLLREAHINRPPAADREMANMNI